jgi:hypothetical protein
MNLSKDRRKLLLIGFPAALVIYLALMVGAPAFIEHDAVARDMGAYHAIRTILRTEMQYRARYGRYATTLTELGPPATGQASSSGAALIDKGLATGMSGGYKYVLTGGHGGYVVTAEPSGFLRGTLRWYADDTLVIRYGRAVEKGQEPDRPIEKPSGSAAPAHAANTRGES